MLLLSLTLNIAWSVLIALGVCGGRSSPRLHLCIALLFAVTPAAIMTLLSPVGFTAPRLLLVQGVLVVSAIARGLPARRGLLKRPQAFWRKLRHLSTRNLRRLSSVVWLYFAAVLLLAICRSVIVLHHKNADAVAYHLPRAWHWAQAGSLLPFPAFNLRQTTFPNLFEAHLSWLVVMECPPRLLGLCNLPYLFVAGAALALAASNLRFTVWTKLCCVILMAGPFAASATSLKNDFNVGVLAFACVALLADAARGTGGKRSWLLAAVAMAAAVGTKATALNLLPCAALAGAWGYRQKTLNRNGLALGGIVLVSCLLLFGGAATVYLPNVLAYGNPLGPRSFLALHQSEQGSFVTNLMRLVHDAFTLPLWPFPSPLFEEWSGVWEKLGYHAVLAREGDDCIFPGSFAAESLPWLRPAGMLTVFACLGLARASARMPDVARRWPRDYLQLHFFVLAGCIMSVSGAWSLRYAPGYLRHFFAAHLVVVLLAAVGVDALAWSERSSGRLWRISLLIWLSWTVADAARGAGIVGMYKVVSGMKPDFAQPYRHDQAVWDIAEKLKPGARVGWVGRWTFSDLPLLWTGHRVDQLTELHPPGDVAELCRVARSHGSDVLVFHPASSGAYADLEKQTSGVCLYGNGAGEEPLLYDVDSQAVGGGVGNCLLRLDGQTDRDIVAFEVLSAPDKALAPDSQRMGSGVDGGVPILPVVEGALKELP